MILDYNSCSRNVGSLLRIMLMVRTKVLEMIRLIWSWIKWPIYIATGILIFLFITQLVECFGADASNKFASMFTPLIVAVVTYVLTTRQHDIADAQREVASQQAGIAASNRDIASANSEIARENKDIAANKLRMDLFEKRYELYQEFMETFREFSRSNDKVVRIVSASDHGTYIPYNSSFIRNRLDEISGIKQKNNEKAGSLYRNIDKMRFLFNQEASRKCRDMIGNIYLYIDEINVNADDIYTIVKNENYKSHWAHAKSAYDEILFITSEYMDLSRVL